MVIQYQQTDTDTARHTQASSHFTFDKHSVMDVCGITYGYRCNVNGCKTGETYPFHAREARMQEEGGGGRRREYLNVSFLFLEYLFIHQRRKTFSPFDFSCFCPTANDEREGGKNEWLAHD